MMLIPGMMATCPVLLLLLLLVVVHVASSGEDDEKLPEGLVVHVVEKLSERGKERVEQLAPEKDKMAEWKYCQAVEGSVWTGSACVGVSQV